MNSSSLMKLPEATLVETVPSSHCLDTVTAMVQLLRAATAESASSPRDKFVFVSDSTLPVKPPHEIFHALTEHSGSDICVMPSFSWGHALRMVDKWDGVHGDGQWSVPLQASSTWAKLP